MEQWIVVIAPLVISPIMTIIVLLVNKKVNKKSEEAKTGIDESTISKQMSEAAALQISTYANNVVKPLIDEVQQLRTEVRNNNERINRLEDELERADAALSFLVDKFKEQDPKSVGRAMRIRRGETGESMKLDVSSIP